MYPSSVNVFEGAFHHAKDPGNFGRKSNGKVRLGFFRQEYAGSHLEMVLRFQFEYPDRITEFLVPSTALLSLTRSIMADTVLGAYNLLLVTNVPFVAIIKQTYPNY